MRIFSLFAFLSLALLLGSCQKDDKGSSAKTKSELITSSSWKYNDAKIDTDNNGTGDVALPGGFIEACQTDNVITFSSNGTGMIDEGATKCDATDPQSIPFTWSFTNNETMINFSSALFAGIGGDFKLVSLTATELIISQSIAVAPPLPNVTVVASFKH